MNLLWLKREGGKSKMFNGKFIVASGPVIVEEIKEGKHNVAPNIKFLIEKVDIK